MNIPTNYGSDLDSAKVIVKFAEYLKMAEEQGWSEEELYYFAKLTLALFEDTLKP
jgi:hypothetical protein